MMEKFGVGATASMARFRSSESRDLKGSDSFPGSFPGRRGWGEQGCTHSLLQLFVSKHSLHKHSLRVSVSRGQPGISFSETVIY